MTNIGDGQRLLVAAGQWQNGQRLFDRISGELLPRSGTDTDAPRFLDVTGTNIADVGASGRGIRFDVTTETDATRVVILFREEGTANWRTLELTGSNGTWFGVAALVGTTEGTRAEFFAQSVDAAGGCVALNPAPTAGPPDDVDGSIRDGRCPDNQPATVTDVAGNSTTVGPVALKIDRKAPALTLSTDQVGAWTNTAVTVTATADDGTGSGIGELCLGDTCDTVNPKTATVDPPPEPSSNAPSTPRPPTTSATPPPPVP